MSSLCLSSYQLSCASFAISVMNASRSGGNSADSVQCTDSAEGINPLEGFPTVTGDK